MASASEWYREERRKTLGTWTAICLGCGGARRFFEESESELPASCPLCGGALLTRCPSCSARLVSAFAVDCDACGSPLRASELAGMRIRRSPR
jgi:ribosomal protein S27E